MFIHSTQSLAIHYVDIEHFPIFLYDYRFWIKP